MSKPLKKHSQGQRRSLCLSVVVYLHPAAVAIATASPKSLISPPT